MGKLDGRVVVVTGASDVVVLDGASVVVFIVPDVDT